MPVFVGFEGDEEKKVVEMQQGFSRRPNEPQVRRCYDVRFAGRLLLTPFLTWLSSLFSIGRPEPFPCGFEWLTVWTWRTVRSGELCPRQSDLSVWVSGYWLANRWSLQVLHHIPHKTFQQYPDKLCHLSHRFLMPYGSHHLQSLSQCSSPTSLCTAARASSFS